MEQGFTGLLNLDLRGGTLNSFDEMSDQELWDLTSDEDDSIKADAYYVLGQRFYHRKRFSDAVSPSIAAKDLYNKVDDQRSEGLAAFSCASILTFLDRHKESIEYFTSAIDLYREHGTDEMVADALKGRADAYEKIDEDELARDDYRSASNFYVAANKRTPAGICLLELGNSLGAGGMQREAFEVFKESLKLFQSAGDFIGSGKAHDRLAAALIDLGEMEEAISNLEEALTIFEYVNDEVRFAYSQYRLGWTLVTVGQYHRAIEMLKQSSDSYKKLERFGDAANADTQLAHAYAAIGYPAEALDLYRKTKTIFDATGRLDDSLLADVNAASVMNPSDLDATVAIYRRVIQTAEDNDIQWIAQACKVRLAETLCKLDAQEQFEEALAIAFSVPEDFWGDNLQERARLINVRANALFELGRDAEAEELLKEVVSQGFASGYAKEMGEAHFLLGLIAKDKGQEDKSEDLIAKAVALYLASGDVAKATELSEMLLPDEPATTSEIFRGEPSGILAEDSDQKD